MTLSVDLFWSVRSPYSYLATGRLVEINRTHDLDIVVRMVLPMAIRDAGSSACADFYKGSREPKPTVQLSPCLLSMEGIAIHMA